ncbi:C-C chemokine receptor type 8-like [Chanodichthys erythropterus]|uniref:C-C chemokine receptor type 8-like n=1 Tax=Chanodichthys erythropterus TaxID=933992 RepID=UPI00351EAF96
MGLAVNAGEGAVTEGAEAAAVDGNGEDGCGMQMMEGAGGDTHTHKQLLNCEDKHSLPANSYVIWLIITGTGYGVASEFFILNLSVCELGICLNGLVFILSRSISSLKITDAFLMGLSFTGRPLFQCLICVERYLAVVHPVTFLMYKPLRYRVICCTAIWFISLGSCLVCMYNLASDKICAHAWFLTMQLTLIISIQLYCLVAVLRALKQSGPGERKREREEENHMKRRSFYLILLTTVTMIFLYFPLAITGISVILTADNSPKVH